nr:hypothetical protein [uncultured Cohaesibacter sp.]
MDQIVFEQAKPSYYNYQKGSPIRAHVADNFCRNLAPSICFYIRKDWLAINFQNLPKTIYIEFGYCLDKEIPIGELRFLASSTPSSVPVAQAPGSFHHRAIFSAWPSLNPRGFDNRFDCMIEHTGENSAQFLIPPSSYVWNFNTMQYEKQ